MSEDRHHRAAAELARRCVRCNKTFRPEAPDWVCASCGSNLDVLYDYEERRRSWSKASLAADTMKSMWRYDGLLPRGRNDRRPTLQTGWTPLYLALHLGSELGVDEIHLKDDGRNPTGSLKDRASAMAVAHAISLKQRVLACASTGNAASALAGMCANTGLTSVILVPEKTPSGKLAQILAFGAYLVRVEGSYDQAFDLAMAACSRFGWYNRNTGINPYLSEGKKTVAFEIAEQLGWEVPDWVLVPVGDGNIIASVGKGFEELLHIGFIERLPRLVAVQSEGSSAIVDALLGDGVVRPVEVSTLADSIAVGRPRDPDRAMRAVVQSSGLAVKVRDSEILDAQSLLARREGIFVEPSAAASLAGLVRLVASGDIAHDARVVLLLTGNGLKDTASVLDRARLPEPIPASLGSLERRLAEDPLHERSSGTGA
jgi:threonine synthase